MFASHAEPMPSVSPTEPLLNTLLPRARALAIAAAEGLVRARCGLGGHTMAMRFEKSRMSLQCMGCGHNTPGWTIQAGACSPLADEPITNDHERCQTTGLLRGIAGKPDR
jgi:hypothetical protein